MNCDIIGTIFSFLPTKNLPSILKSDNRFPGLAILHRYFEDYEITAFLKDENKRVLLKNDKVTTKNKISLALEIDDAEVVYKLIKGYPLDSSHSSHSPHSSLEKYATHTAMFLKKYDIALHLLKTTSSYSKRYLTSSIANGKEELVKYMLEEHANKKYLQEYMKCAAFHNQLNILKLIVKYEEILPITHYRCAFFFGVSKNAEAILFLETFGHVPPLYSNLQINAQTAKRAFVSAFCGLRRGRSVERLNDLFVVLSSHTTPSELNNILAQQIKIWIRQSPIEVEYLIEKLSKITEEVEYAILGSQNPKLINKYILKDSKVPENMNDYMKILCGPAALGLVSESHLFKPVSSYTRRKIILLACYFGNIEIIKSFKSRIAYNTLIKSVLHNPNGLKVLKFLLNSSKKFYEKRGYPVGRYLAYVRCCVETRNLTFCKAVIGIIKGNKHQRPFSITSLIRDRDLDLVDLKKWMVLISGLYKVDEILIKVLIRDKRMDYEVLNIALDLAPKNLSLDMEKIGSLGFLMERSEKLLILLKCGVLEVGERGEELMGVAIVFKRHKIIRYLLKNRD